MFLTTHFMDEAQHLAHRVAVMRAGEIIAEGAPDELGGRDRRPAEVRFGLPEGIGLDDLPAVACESRSLERAARSASAGSGRSGAHAVLLTREPLRAAHTLTGWAIERGLELPGLSIAQPSLEDIYLKLTGEPLPPHAPFPSSPVVPA